MSYSSGSSSPSLNGPTAGAFRFNTDSSQLEIYDGNQWTGVLATSPNQQTGGTRGVYGGGNASPVWGTKIDYINIATTGNAIEFGTMANPVSSSMAGASRTRAVWFAGNQPGAPHSPYIQKIEFASTGNSVNFGTMMQARWGGGTCSNGIRAVTAGGSNSGDENNGNNWIEYITISEGGTGQDFGDLSTSGVYLDGVSSPTRGVLYTGKIGSSPNTDNSNTIQYITIATTGNSSDFGDSTSTGGGRKGGSNAITGIWGGGNPGSGYTNAIDSITIATLGNATDFGDLTEARYWPGCTTSSTRAVWAGGYITSPATSRPATIDYVQISSRGNAVDYGDLVSTPHVSSLSGASNGHGGL